MTLQVDASFGVIACCGIILSPTATVLSMHKSARMSVFAASFALELRFESKRINLLAAMSAVCFT
ncbi:MAG: hypothetical protein PUP92_17210 [Rhizonema sp. PD38]|nr:hypothetical protein [Rhizonema sp. PD38]